jgi:hypothetical protein
MLEVQCRRCGGLGYVRIREALVATCPVCEGTGRVFVSQPKPTKE